MLVTCVVWKLKHGVRCLVGINVQLQTVHIHARVLLLLTIERSATLALASISSIVVIGTIAAAAVRVVFALSGLVVVVVVAAVVDTVVATILVVGMRNGRVRRTHRVGVVRLRRRRRRVC